jgi:hypothetical protein
MPIATATGRLGRSNLGKVDVHGNKRHDNPYPVNPSGFVMHSAKRGSKPVVCYIPTLGPGRV